MSTLLGPHSTGGHLVVRLWDRRAPQDTRGSSGKADGRWGARGRPCTHANTGPDAGAHRPAPMLERTCVRPGAARSASLSSCTLGFSKCCKTRTQGSPKPAQGALQLCLAFPSIFLIYIHFFITTTGHQDRGDLQQAPDFSGLGLLCPKREGLGSVSDVCFCSAGGVLPGHGLGALCLRGTAVPIHRCLEIQ